MLNKYLDLFLDYLKVQKNYSSHTILNYQHDILDYYEYMVSNNKNFLKVTYSDAKQYLLYLYEERCEKPATVSRKISSLRSFYRFLSNQGISDNSSFDLLSLPKKEKKLPKFFEYNELEMLFEVPDLKDPLGQRNALILELLYATGIRVSELVSLKVSDIHKSNMTIEVLGKGNKMRIVYFNKITLRRLELYLNDGYRTLNKNNSPYLFLNKLGTVLTTRGVQDILNRIIKQTALKKNISPHMIRHSFATHLLNEGCDLLSVQELLGHSSLSATSVYTHITTDRIKEVYLKAHPRARKK